MRLNYVSEVKLLCKRVSNNCLSEVKRTNCGSHCGLCNIIQF